MDAGRIDPHTLLSYTIPPFRVDYAERDVSLYAFGVGAPTDPLDPDELKFVYELSSAGFYALPTFSVIVLSRMVEIFLGGLPGLRFNPLMLVHGEHALTTVRPLATRGTLEARPVIRAVYDKGSAAVVVVDIECADGAGETAARHQASLFIKGLGGFGGERGPSAADPTPSRPPDVTHDERTSPAQALLYRLSGDTNPLHADPALASFGGYDRPILHGLCTYGYAARALMRHCAGNDPARFREMRARFSRPALPGETLRTEIWREGAGIVFRTLSVERGEVLLSHGTAGVE